MRFSTLIQDPRTARILPWLVASAFFMQMLDGTILNTALPGMARELGVAPLKMQSVIIAYMLTTALLIPASGWVADRFGTRKVFVFAIGLFTFGSVLCAVSTTLQFLIFARIIQGMGGALMVPVGRLAILRGYPRAELVRVLSFVTVPGLLGPLMGPIMGGFFVEYASWHWIFLINLPVGLVGCWAAWKYMPDLREPEGKFDIWGFMFFSLSMVLISLSMEGFGELQLPRVQTTMMCIAGLGLLAAYWVHAQHISTPLFSPHLFRTRSFAVGICGNLFSRLGSGAMPFLLPLFLQLVLGFSPFRAGLTMIPTALAAIAGKQFITSLVKYAGFRAVLIGNTLMLSCIIAAFGFVDHDTPYVYLLGLLAIMGAFNSMQFTAMNSVTLIDLDEREASSGNSLLSVTMQISATIGIAMAGILLAGFSSLFDASSGSGHSIEVFHYTFLCVGAIGLITACIFGQIPGDSGMESDPQKSKTSMTDPQML